MSSANVTIKVFNCYMPKMVLQYHFSKYGKNSQDNENVAFCNIEFGFDNLTLGLMIFVELNHSGGYVHTIFLDISKKI